ncbi:MAG: hypothetical protein QOF92_265 [Pseudonocardiales bacterium]|nr:hypothetical protein [Pseudonocardiales bacterium]
MQPVDRDEEHVLDVSGSAVLVLDRGGSAGYAGDSDEADANSGRDDAGALGHEIPF